MKTFILVIFFVAMFSTSNAQDSELIGTWNIIEFTITNDENSETMTQDKLKEDSSVWDLFIMEDGQFKQTSNMSGTDTMESQEGTWKTSGDNLTFHLQMNNQNFDLIYTYELDENVLILMRSNPMGTMKIVSKFRKK